MDEYRYLTELTERYPVLKQVEGDIRALYETVRESYENGGKLLIAGNGGSCADSEHIVGELMKGFVKKRSVPEEMAQSLKAVDPERGEKLAASLQQGLAAIALTGHTALSTAFLNDVDGEVIYAQQVYGYGNPGPEETAANLRESVTRQWWFRRQKHLKSRSCTFLFTMRCA